MDAVSGQGSPGPTFWGPAVERSLECRTSFTSHLKSRWNPGSRIWPSLTLSSKSSMLHATASGFRESESFLEGAYSGMRPAASLTGGHSDAKPVAKKAITRQIEL